MKLKNLSFYLLALGVGLVSQATLAQALQKDVDEVSAVWRTDLSNTFTTQTPLLKMVPGGQAISLRMSGLNNEQYLDFGVLADEVVTEGKLQINFTASPSLIAKRSQLNIFLNGKLQKTIAFEARCSTNQASKSASSSVCRALSRALRVADKRDSLGGY